jgi:predicted transcriptional regulator YheO
MCRECDSHLEPLIPVVKLLGAMLGKDYEIVLHDISGEEPFIVAIENGEVSGRDINSSMTDFGYFLMSSPEAEDVDHVVNYPSETETGKSLRSGVALIRGENRKLIGFLCINFDMTRGQVLKDMGEFLTALKPLSFQDLELERFSRVNDTSAEEILEKVRHDLGKPLNSLSRSERAQCIDMLEGYGFFNLKGAVRILASRMGKSRYTLYADLRAYHSRRKE